MTMLARATSLLFSVLLSLPGWGNAHAGGMIQPQPERLSFEAGDISPFTVTDGNPWNVLVLSNETDYGLQDVYPTNGVMMAEITGDHNTTTIEYTATGVKVGSTWSVDVGLFSRGHPFTYQGFTYGNDHLTASVNGITVWDMLLADDPSGFAWDTVSGKATTDTLTFDFSIEDHNSTTGFMVDNVTFWPADIASTSSVPEPGTLALLGLGIAGIGFIRRR